MNSFPPLSLRYKQVLEKKTKSKMFDLENTNLKLLNCIFLPTVSVQSKYVNNLCLQLRIF